MPKRYATTDGDKPTLFPHLFSPCRSRRVMSEEMQLELEHTLKTMRELKEAKAEIERLRAALRDVLSYVSPRFPIPVTIYDNARAALAEEKQ